MVDFARYEESGSVTAGPLEGKTWSGVTPASRFWPEIMKWVSAGNAITPYTQPPPPVPEKISDRQFFQQMAVEGKITQAEALAAVATGTIPAAMDTLIEQLPQGQRFPARMLVSGATEFLRDHPVTLLIGQLYGFTPPDIDRIWRDAALL